MPPPCSYTRRDFISATTAALLSSPLARKARGQGRGEGLIAGAIRWDAWYKKTDASVFAQRSLSTKSYVGRAPFFCSADSNWNVTCNGSALEMSDEIHAASRAGLKYWAFDWYSNQESSLRVAWNLYRASPNRNLMNWCGVIGLDSLGYVPFSSGKWKDGLVMWADYLREPNYQCVVVNGAARPLLYLLWNDDQFRSYFDKDLNKVKLCFEYLRVLLAQRNMRSPYIVLLNGVAGAPISQAISADAISNYISDFRGEGAGPFPYSDLDKQTRNYWDALASTGVPMVPIAMVGWDNRPRQERPVPWQPATPKPHPTRYFIAPSAGEFASHLKCAVDFISRAKVSCPSRTLLIYSWDECDEGGGLIPSLGDPGASYLAAMGRVISS